MSVLGFSVYLFDFDYTLANAERGIVACFRHVLDMHGHTGVTDYAICRTIGHTVADSFEMLTGVKDVLTLQQYRREFTRRADDIMVDSTVLYPEAVSTLERLKARGVKTGIVSTKLRIRITGTLMRYNIPHLVDIIIGGEDVAAPKPDPEGVYAAISRLDAEKEDVLYIGDSLVDAYTAKNAGVAFAAVTTGTTTPEEFNGLPYIKIMKDIRELI